MKGNNADTESQRSHGQHQKKQLTEMSAVHHPRKQDVGVLRSRAQPCCALLWFLLLLSDLLSYITFVRDTGDGMQLCCGPFLHLFYFETRSH